ncbi:MAG: hypothetical protein WAQ98_00890, partial [Blastocatellia bacterium]
MRKFKVVLSLLLSLLLCQLWPIQGYGQTTGIIPSVTVEPGIFQTSKTTTAVVTISNIGATNIIATGDRFALTFNATFGTINSINPQALVANSPSGFTSNQFTISGPSTRGEVSISYIGASRNFVVGDGFSIQINFTPSSIAGHGVIVANLVGFATPTTSRYTLT